MKVLHLHKLTGVSGSEGHLLALLPALRAAGVDACFLGLDVPGSDAPRFYERLRAAEVPFRSVRCGPDLSPRMARDVTRAVRAERPDDVDPDATFAAIYANPPIRIGKAALHALLLRWLPRLEIDGRAYLVVHRNLGSDSLQRWLDGVGHPCERIASVRGYRVLAVAPSTAVDR